MVAENFDPVTTELKQGINLIEASAGTGKTYAIAMLVLRFVVERDLDIKELLVVTFTKAATEELKARIRNRLTEARLALNGECEKSDTNVLNWLQASTLTTDTIRQRLDHALLDIDQAGIFTIHGFCQRILAEHALESGQLFDCELTGDIAAIKQACADDFWRKQLYQRSAWEASLLTCEYQTPDELLNSVDFIDPQQIVYPDFVELDSLFATLKKQSKSAAHALDTTLSAIQSALAEGKFTKSYAASLPSDSGEMKAWLSGQSTVMPDFSILTGEALLNGLNGSKFRVSRKNPLSSAEQKSHYLQACTINSEPFDQLSATLSQLNLSFRRALLQTLRVEVNNTLQHKNVMSFDDLIKRLADALQGEKGNLLIKELQQRYKSALIDEFQDTDQNQWFIFSSLFSAADQYLYLIGDPKQAIYKFRGADIFSYFAAQQQAQHHFTLGKNWRSHPQLVEAVNQLFQKQRPFLFKQLDFKAVSPALSVDAGSLCQNHEPLAPLVLWQLDKNIGRQEYWTAGKAATAIRDGVINEILQLLNEDYRIITEQAEQRLLPNDIAILVRSNTQARDYQQALREVGIPSVLNSKESVFASVQADDIYTVLQALAQPGHIPFLKQALTVNWFNLNGQQLYQLGNDETELDGWVSGFQDYQQEWMKNGLMSMMQRLFRQEKVEASLSLLPQAERILTNLHHIIELLQQAAIDEHLGINKTLDWLHHTMHQARQNNNSADEQQLRLESDEDAVKIVTMHSAKGLEYPVVFCPSLWKRNDRLKSEKKIIKCHEDGEMIADLGSPHFERHRQLALDEELAEDIRLFYVAVTRAKYRCYINWADVRTQKAANDSAMAYLLDLYDDNFAEQQTRLQSFSTIDNSSFAYHLLATETEMSRPYQPAIATDEISCRLRSRSLYTHWQMSSYTALSALSLHDAPELPKDKADEPQSLDTTKADIEQLPKGAHTGNVLHDLLENLSFSAIAAGLDISIQRNKACLHYGLNIDNPVVIDQLLQAVVKSPLTDDPDFCLANIADRHCLKEMPFYLSIKAIDVAEINNILQDCPAYQPLSSRQMCGYLTGFIDLICEYEGKYYVMDYKSNTLDNYQHDRLTAAMREHNYGLQYWIYTLVLHQYLQKRLPEYDYESHFGGVKYLFVRGMSADKAGSGVYSDRPGLSSIEKLAELFFKR
jgi:exodeoxyribonuclease V beta subunit